VVVLVVAQVLVRTLAVEEATEDLDELLLDT
jgi:hypothetical protein